MIRSISLHSALRFAIIAILVSSLVGAESGSWNQFRGPNGSGVAPGCKPPVKLDGNLAWKIPVPPGLSAPVVFGDLIFLTAVEGERLVTLAYDKSTGKLAWRQAAPESKTEKVHKANSLATPTPFADKDRVYVYFGSYGLLCYDHQGREQWKKPIPAAGNMYGTATSPIGHGDKLILVLDNDANLPNSRVSQSKVVALNKANGDLVWETPRPLQRSSWSTPILWQYVGGEDLVIFGNGRVYGYHPETGAEKWSVTGFSREAITSPVSGSGHLFVVSAQGGTPDEDFDPEPFWKAILQFDNDGDQRIARGEMTEHFTFPFRPELPPGHPGFGLPMPTDPARRKQRQNGLFHSVDKNKDGFWTRDEFVAHTTTRRGNPILKAIRPGGQGDVTDSHVTWQLRKSIPEIPSPLFYQDRLYLVRNGGVLAAVDAAQGEILYRKRLGGSGMYSASPVVANDHLYLASDQGLVSVVKTGDYELVHQHDLKEAVLVTPALDATTIYIRTRKHLWAFRTKN